VRDALEREKLDFGSFYVGTPRSGKTLCTAHNFKVVVEDKLGLEYSELKDLVPYIKSGPKVDVDKLK
jgi:hypothetical protein